MRIRWNGADRAELKARLAEHATLGVGHVWVGPENRERDGWDAILEGVSLSRKLDGKTSLDVAIYKPKRRHARRLDGRCPRA